MYDKEKVSKIVQGDSILTQQQFCLGKIVTDTDSLVTSVKKRIVFLKTEQEQRLYVQFFS